MLDQIKQRWAHVCNNLVNPFSSGSTYEKGKAMITWNDEQAYGERYFEMRRQAFQHAESDILWLIKEVDSLRAALARCRPNDGRSGRCGVRISGDLWCVLDLGHPGDHA